MQAKPTEDSPITAINITPLVDVSLVLVMVFMITMPFLMEKAMKVKSSGEKAVPVGSVTQPILVEVSPEAIRVEGRMTSAQELGGALRRLMEERRVQGVAVLADGTVRHARVVQVLDAAMGSGAQELDLLEPEEARHDAVGSF